MATITSTLLATVLVLLGNNNRKAFGLAWVADIMKKISSKNTRSVIDDKGNDGST
jgi:hypothetical protein